MVYMRMMGARVKRKEDPRLITGSSTYVDDLRLQGLGHLAILRSIYGHATITGIDTSAAKALPGVIAVYTGEEFKGFTGPMPHGGGPVGHESHAVPHRCRSGGTNTAQQSPYAGFWGAGCDCFAF